MKSARAALVAATLALVLVPLFALAVAWSYEAWLVSSYEERLTGLSQQVLARWPADASALQAFAQQHGVALRVVAPEGVQLEASPPADAADQLLFARGPFEVVTDFLVSPPTSWESFAAAEAGFGPPQGREEVAAALAGAQRFAVHLSPSGETSALVLASPTPDGRVLTVTYTSHRGVRRLLALRREMARLALYQGAAALVMGLLLARWLVKPLRGLAQRAQRYPSEPLATSELLEREDEIGQLARAMHRLTDSLERRRREAVERAADVAHEFKNPLATIAAAAEHLGSTRALSDEKRKLLSEASAGAAARLLSATEALLSLARLEAALPEEAREAVDYRALLEEALAPYRADVRWQGVDIHLAVAPEVGQVSVVPAAWQRLVSNLVDNALVQPATTQRVEVSATRTSEGVVTQVRDFGPGVSEGNRARIFQRFFTLRPAGAAPGTGLGLSIVQAVAEAHGGQVTLAPPEVGSGATFQVTLPGAHPA